MKEIVYKIIKYREPQSNIPSERFEVYIDGSKIYEKDYVILTADINTYLSEYQEYIASLATGIRTMKIKQSEL